MSTIDHLESKFSSLIQPIKDLASNWDIDIADSLTNYLEELDSLRISVDGSNNQLNFAEAALLIQGSAAVYSKKVEYLYQLVVQSLEFITHKKSSVLTGGGREKSGKDGNISAFDEESMLFEKDPKFLLLDNLIEQGKNIDLNFSLNNISGSAGQPANRFSGEHNSALLGDASRNTSMAWNTSMMADDRTGNSLKLSTSFMDKSGALLIGGSVHQFGNEEKATNSLNSFYADDDDNNSHFDHHDDDNDYGVGGGSSFVQQQDLVGDFDNNAGSGEMQLSHTPLKNSAASAQTKTVLAPKPASIPVQYEMMDPHAVVAGSRAVKRGKPYKTPASMKNNASSAVDDTKLKHVDVFWNGTPSLAQFWGTLENNFPSSAAATTGKRALFNPSLLPIYSAYKAIGRKEKEALKKSNKSAANNAYSTTEYSGFRYAEEAVDDGEYNADNYYPPAGGGGDDDDDDNDYDGGDGFGFGSFEQPISNGLLANENGAGDYADDDNNNNNEFKDEEEELAHRLEAVLADDLLSEGANGDKMSYTAILKAHMEKFTQGAEQYARETQLSRRVSDWTTRLEPILKMQEETTPFDIHSCSDMLLTDLQEAVQTRSLHGRELSFGAPHAGTEKVLKSTPIGEEEAKNIVTFGDIVHGQSAPEVCRTFLACLQLANLGNVVIDPEGELHQHREGETAHDAERAALDADFNVMLVKMSKTSIESFRAPSLQQEDEVDDTTSAAAALVDDHDHHDVEQQKSLLPAAPPAFAVKSALKKTSSIVDNTSTSDNDADAATAGKKKTGLGGVSKKKGGKKVVRPTDWGENANKKVVNFSEI